MSLEFPAQGYSVEGVHSSQACHRADPDIQVSLVLEIVPRYEQAFVVWAREGPALGSWVGTLAR